MILLQKEENRDMKIKEILETIVTEGLRTFLFESQRKIKSDLMKFN